MEAESEPLISPAIGSVVGLGLSPDQAGIAAAGIPDLIQAAKTAWTKHDCRTFYVCFPFDLKHADGNIVHCEVSECIVHSTSHHMQHY